jgi:hypothetical protein
LSPIKDDILCFPSDYQLASSVDTLSHTWLSTHWIVTYLLSPIMQCIEQSEDCSYIHWGQLCNVAKPLV